MKSAEQWADALTPLPTREVLLALITQIQSNAFADGYVAGEYKNETGETYSTAWMKASASAT